MESRLLLLIASLILSLAILSCDGGGNGGGCTEILGESNYMLAFQGCPNDGIKAVCNSFECEFIQQIGGPPPPIDVAIINGETCSRFDLCNNLDCDLFSDTGEPEDSAIISTLEILQGNSFTGTANVNGVAPLDFVCNIILP